MKGRMLGYIIHSEGTIYIKDKYGVFFYKNNDKYILLSPRDIIIDGNIISINHKEIYIDQKYIRFVNTDKECEKYSIGSIYSPYDIFETYDPIINRFKNIINIMNKI